MSLFYSQLSITLKVSDFKPSVPAALKDKPLLDSLPVVQTITNVAGPKLEDLQIVDVPAIKMQNVSDPVLKGLSQEFNKIEALNTKVRELDLNQEYSEFLLEKDDDPIRDAIKYFEDELIFKETIQAPSIMEPTAFSKLLQHVVRHYVQDEDKLKDLNEDQMKFILKFLVCMVLKNFAVNQKVVLPDGDKARQQ